MFARITSKSVFENPYLLNLIRMLFFGLFSYALGELKFFLPGVESGMSDLREVGILISAFYLPNWWYLIGVSLITSFGSFSGGFDLVLSSFLVHSFSSLIFWFIINRFNRFQKNTYLYSSVCLLGILVYYVVFLFPSLIFSRYLFDRISAAELITTYKAIIYGGRFEVITTAAIVSLWAALSQIRKTLLLRNTELEQAKTLAENSNKLKSAFLQNLSHEIRTPLNAIIGFTELLFDPDLEPTDRENYKLVVENNSKNLLRLIDKTLLIAKIDTGELKQNQNWFNLDTLKKELETFVLKEIKALEKTNLEFTFDQTKNTQNIEVFTDGSLLKKILINLLQNAVNFTRVGKVSLKLEKQNNHLQFIVADSGIGISRKDQKLVFERFYKANQAGSNIRGIGLGLTIVEKMVHLLQGEITFKSFENVGTTFYVNIPVEIRKTETAKSETKDPIISSPPAGKERIILVAEDDDINYLFIAKLLQKESYTVIRALNGKEAVDLVQNENGIRLVLMDLKMPVMDGIEATKLIKQQHPNLPVVAQTGFAFDEDRNAALEAGCTHFVSKPIRKKKLLQIIDEIL